MKKYHLLSIFVLLIFISINSCNSSEDDVIITGQVSDADSGDPILGATVEIESPLELSDFVKTDSSGNYQLAGIEITDVTDISITASAANFTSASQTIKVAPSDVLNNIDFELTPSDSQGPDESGGDEVSGEPEGAAAIILESLSSESINIRQTGGNISSRFTFTVVDSAGRAINTEGAVDVQFSILKGPGGGETVIPQTVTTNASGKAVTSLFSGDSAGVVRVRATIRCRYNYHFRPYFSCY